MIKAMMRMVSRFQVGTLIAIALTGWLVGRADAQPATSPLLGPDSPAMNQRAPDVFSVRLETSKGLILIEVHRDWAPLGADRFYSLVALGFYDGARFFRVVRGSWAQFGINGDPRIAKIWRHRRIADDPVRESNRRGFLCYAMAGPDDRTTQVFINLADNLRLDAGGFAPFGRVVEGMDVVDRLYDGYGESAGGGIRGGKQDPLFEGGNAYLIKTYPKLDYVETATIERP